jgi:hypothetical protein
MSFRDCLNRAVEQGRANEAKAARVLKTYDDLVRGLEAEGRSPVEANIQASKDILKDIEGKTAADKRRRLASAQRQVELEDDIQSTVDEFGNAAPDQALQNIIINLDARIDTNRGLLHESINQFLNEFGYKGLGLKRKRANLNGVRDALYGEGGTPTDKMLAKALVKMSELRVMLLREAGLDVAHDPKWRLPQNHSKALMKDAEVDKWVGDHMKPGILDWDRMRDFNDGLPIRGAEKQEEVLRKAFASIISDGANNIVPGARVDASLSTRLERPRTLHYKSSGSWGAMMDKYGEGDMFQQISIFIETTATDISIIQKLGPNPKSGLQFAIDTARQHAQSVQPSGLAPRGIGPGVIGKRKGLLDRVNEMAVDVDEGFQIMSGANAMTEENILGRTAAGFRNGLISSLLGSTPLISVPGDMVTSALAAHRNGLRSHTLILRLLKQLNPLSRKDRQAGMSSGLVMETLISRASAAKRFTGDSMAPGWTRSLSDVTTRVSGLSQSTRGAKYAIGMEFQASLARASTTGFKRLDKSLRKSMERHGITAEDWDIIRATKIYDPGGFNQLRPTDLFKRTDLPDAERIRLHGLVGDMMNKIILEGVPEATTLSSVALGRAIKRGTWRGEIAGFGAMLKSFPVAIYQIHLRTYYREMDLKMGKVGYLPAYVVGSGGAGVLALQLGALAQGKDFYDMSQPSTWGAGLLKGGGLGIMGDFLFSNLNRFGGGMADTLAGPFFGMASDTTNLSVGNLNQMLRGEDTNLTVEALGFLNSWLPGTRTWYLRLLKERLIVDQIRLEADPKARAKMMRRERDMKRNQGRSSFWPAGAPFDQAKMPDFSTAFGE